MDAQHRALLQTDIVDSTRLSEQWGDAVMAPIWEAHDHVARDLLQLWRGKEIDKSDGFLLMFDVAPDAVAYAVAYHAALRGLRVPMQARVGLHVGQVTTRENRSDDVVRGAKVMEIDGLAKPVTARVMSLAMGGQTLLTAQARDALSIVPPDRRIQSHGHWRFKGIEEPAEVFEVGDIASAFMPPHDSQKAYRVVRRADLWIPAREIPHSLPAERDAFVGREAALRQMADRFAQGARLLSILGIGGAGKTRLAQRYGWTWLGEFPGGVWFCDLAAATTLDGILHAVAQALDVPLSSADPLGQLGNAIAGRGSALVILDNFEQVSRFAEQAIGSWLNRAAEARFIVTTREVLGIPGEEILTLGSLTQHESESLFLRRATASAHDFSATAEERVAIDSLVKLLDGLPLAIELAAARIRVMRPRALLDRMNQRFKLLASGSGRRDRQATLRNAFDWSWDLLSATEKAALAQLSVFEGGFNLRAAEAVLDFSDCDAAAWTVDVLQSLVEKSFVRQMPGQRFDLFVSVRDYASEHLAAEGRFPGSGPLASTAACARHSCFFAGVDPEHAIAERCADADNLVLACRRACKAGDSQCAVGGLAAAWEALRLRGPYSVAASLATMVGEMQTLASDQRAIVSWVKGNAQQMLGQTIEARASFDEGLNLAREAGALRTEGWLLCGLGEHMTADGQPQEALTLLSAAVEWAEQVGDRLLQCQAFNGLGAVTSYLGRTGESRSFYEAALALARDIGNVRWQGGLLGNLGGLLHSVGKLTEASRYYLQALELARETGDRRWEGNTLCNLGLLCYEEKRFGEAHTQLAAALDAARQMGHRRLEGTTLCNLGLVAEAQAEPQLAEKYYADSIVVSQALGDRRSEGQVRAYLGLLLARRRQFDDASECLQRGEILLLEVSDQVNYGLLLCKATVAYGLADRKEAALDALNKLNRHLEENPNMLANLASEAAEANAAVGRMVDVSGMVTREEP
jgi:predicted ATPase/class 3 adenylate cyclase/Tfp pilus assembly protein PilF